MSDQDYENTIAGLDNRIEELEEQVAELREAAQAHLEAWENGSVEDEGDTADALKAALEVEK